jgi:hypothetical protein
MALTLTFRQTNQARYLVELITPEGGPCPSPGISTYLLINQRLQRRDHRYELIPTADFGKKFRFELATPYTDPEEHKRDIAQAIEDTMEVNVLTS